MSEFDLRFWTFDYLFPWAFALLAFVWALVGFWIYTKGKGKFFWSRSPKNIAGEDQAWIGIVLPHVSKLFYVLALVSLTFGIAGPHRLNEDYVKQMQYSEGIDIIISLDISLSMMARDFVPNRLEASKRVAAEFVRNRPNDRIGLVLYEGEAYTACPATTDHKKLLQHIAEIKPGVLETNATAIGLGLGLAVARLRDDNLKSKVIILMSDGVSNAGEIDPYTAAELAKNKNVRVYTIGVGSNGTAPYPVQTPFGIQNQQMEVDIDEEALTYIANQTGGKYFRATDDSALEEIYSIINEMEKTEMIGEFSKFQIPVQSKPFYITALLLALIGVLFSKQILRGIAHE
jgi:Ca-activated chloride channel family protein